LILGSGMYVDVNVRYEAAWMKGKYICDSARGGIVALVPANAMYGNSLKRRVRILEGNFEWIENVERVPYNPELFPGARAVQNKHKKG
jgi:hypothetical protein